MLLSAASPWVRRWAHLIPQGGRVLDVACGSGRHVHFLVAHGWQVTAVDHDAAALTPLAGIAETVVADLEGAPWPLPGRRFEGVLVTNYLWRGLFPALADALAEGGALIYETFAVGQEDVGRPKRPEFLLRRGELLERAAAAGLTVVAYEDGWLGDDGTADPLRCVQRIAAVAGLAHGVGRPRLGG